MEGSHASFVETVPFKYIAIFTIFQVVYLLICFGVTWIPIAGILFPLPFFLLITIREKLLPKLFQPCHLQELDASEYEEIAGAPKRSRSISFTVRFFSPCHCSVMDQIMASKFPCNHENSVSNGVLKLLLRLGVRRLCR